MSNSKYDMYTYFYGSRVPSLKLFGDCRKKCSIDNFKYIYKSDKDIFIFLFIDYILVKDLKFKLLHDTEGMFWHF